MEHWTARPNTPILHYSNFVHLDTHWLDLNRDIHARGEIEFFQLVHGLGGGGENVEKALVGALLEGFLRFLVRVRGAQDREALDAGGQGDGPGDAGAGAFYGAGDVGGRGVEERGALCL